MKRLIAYIEKKISETKTKNREERIMNLLDSANLSATEKLIEYTDRRDSIMKRLSEDTLDTKKFVKDLNDCFNDIREATEELKRVEEIKKYLTEEI